MPRSSLSDPQIRDVINGCLLPLLAEHGSVNALTEALNQGLQSRGIGDRIYPNRIHALLSDDPSRSVNQATVELVKSACASLLTAGGGRRNSESWKRLYSEVLRQWQAGTISLDRVPSIAADVNAPPAAIRYILEQSGQVMNARDRILSANEGFALDYRPTPPHPDWRFQDDAVRKCIEAFESKPGARVGLIIPTAGGKTRTALKISIDFARRRESGKIVWVTHRRNLRDQAQEEFQDLLNDGAVTADDARIIADRIEFVMLGELARRLSDTHNPPALVIVDEAHHAAAPSYAPLFETLYLLPALFLTATPNRTDDLPIGIDKVAYSITYRDLANRGVVVLPTFEDIPVEDFDWSGGAIADLADHLIERTKDDLKKVIVLTPRIEKAEEFYSALRERYMREQYHPLGLDDIGFVHSDRNSHGVATKEFLNDFRAKSRAIYVATQILLEGFNDPSVNAVVITYPSSSLVQLMQAAGRCMRASPGKRSAYVIQAKNERLAYHFDHRWLYQEISDALRPQLETKEFQSEGERKEHVRHLLAKHNIPEPLRVHILNELDRMAPDASVRLLLCGVPYFGQLDRFDNDAIWTGVLETPENSAELRWIFNDFSARGAIESNPASFLDLYGRKFGFHSDVRYGSKYRAYADMLLSQYQAQCELTGKPIPSQGNRPFHLNGATTWLKYINLEYCPMLSPALQSFLADCHNRDAIAARIAQCADGVALAIKIRLPLGQNEAWILGDAAAAQLLKLRDDINMHLERSPLPRHGELFEAALAQAAGITSLPHYVVRRIDQLLPADSFERCALRFRGPSNNSSQRSDK